MKPARHLKRWASRIRREIRVLLLAMRDPRVPWFAKAVAALVVAYALSPLDLIPDFIPVIGYLDDLILLPLGILLAIRLIPATVLDDLRRRARRDSRALPPSRVGAAAVAAIWLAVAAALISWLLQLR